MNHQHITIIRAKPSILLFLVIALFFIRTEAWAKPSKDDQPNISVNGPENVSLNSGANLKFNIITGEDTDKTTTPITSANYNSWSVNNDFTLEFGFDQSTPFSVTYSSGDFKGDILAVYGIRGVYLSLPSVGGTLGVEVPSGTSYNNTLFKYNDSTYKSNWSTWGTNSTYTGYETDNGFPSDGKGNWLAYKNGENTGSGNSGTKDTSNNPNYGDFKFTNTVLLYHPSLTLDVWGSLTNGGSAVSSWTGTGRITITRWGESNPVPVVPESSSILLLIGGILPVIGVCIFQRSSRPKWRDYF